MPREKPRPGGMPRTDPGPMASVMPMPAITTMSREDAVRLLRSGPAGVAQFNERRRDRPLPLDLSQVDLSGQDLSGANLMNVNMRGANLRGCQLVDSVLDDVDLAGADIKDTDLRAVDVRRVRLGHATLFSRIGWPFVRAVGLLQILTRVSYLMLLLVPMLAAFWQPLRNYADKLSQASQAITDKAAQEIPELTMRLREAATRAGTRDKAADRLDHALDVLDGFVRDIRATPYRPKIPSSWAIAFFAALFVALGHLTYQMWAPELVKAKDEEMVANEALAAYNDTAPDRNDRLRAALASLDELVLSLPQSRNANLVQRFGETIWLPNQLWLYQDDEEMQKQTDHVSPKEKPSSPSAKRDRSKRQSRLSDASREGRPGEPYGEPHPGDPPSPYEPTRPFEPTSPLAGLRPDQTVEPRHIRGPALRRIAIDEGARARYRYQSLRNWHAAIVAVALYSLAGLLVGLVIVQQSIGVAQAAGWFG
jgi:hypothetical protein